MNGFEFLMTLFGLLLGLALAEGLGGLASALNSRQRVRIGWPTALLGIFVSCDVVTFWINGWGMRNALEVNWPTVFGGFVITAIAYISASLIFPKDPDEWRDLDAHFDRNRRIVLGGMLSCNLAFFAAFAALSGIQNPFEWRKIIIIWSLFPVGLIAMFAPQRPIVIGALVWMIGLYPLSLVWRNS
jgi:hypothetical protein